MLNPVTIKLMKDDGTERAILIEPLLDKQASGLVNTGVYKIYKSDDDETFFTEPLLISTITPTRDDSSNPDYLGDLIFSADKANWNYNGDLLSLTEQQQVADYIKNVS
jgi:hypothetical protein